MFQVYLCCWNKRLHGIRTDNDELMEDKEELNKSLSNKGMYCSLYLFFPILHEIQLGWLASQSTIPNSNQDSQQFKKFTFISNFVWDSSHGPVWSENAHSFGQRLISNKFLPLFWFELNKLIRKNDLVMAMNLLRNLLWLLERELRVLTSSNFQTQKFKQFDIGRPKLIYAVGLYFQKIVKLIYSTRTNVKVFLFVCFVNNNHHHHYLVLRLKNIMKINVIGKLIIVWNCNFHRITIRMVLYIFFYLQNINEFVFLCK